MMFDYRLDPKPMSAALTHTLDLLMCQTFRDLFVAAVHNSPSLSKVQKFNYLKAQLQEEALRAIARLTLTKTNYDHAIALLTLRYGQPHKIIQARQKLT